MQTIQVTDPTPKLRTTLFGVQGMTCSACTNTIEDAIKPLPSVQNVSISLLNNSMTVTYDGNGITPEELVGLVDDLGYDAAVWETKEDQGEKHPTSSEEREVTVKFAGGTSSDDATRLNEYLSSLKLQSFTPLSSSSWLSTLRYTPTETLTIRAILSKSPHPFTASLYTPPSLYSRSREIQRKEARKTLRLFLASTVFAIPTFIIGIVGMLLLPETNPFRQWCQGVGWWGGASRAVILLWILATLVQFGIARIFFIHGWASLRFQRKWSTLFRFGNMNLLVALSTGVAYVASVVMMVIDIRTDPHMASMSKEMRSYFDSSVFLTFFILAGKALEARAKLRTGDAIAMLGQLRPERAVLLRSEPQSPVDLKSQHSEEVSLDMLEIGDHILVRPGSIPPADGIVIEGTTTVDESSLTGESIPVTKNVGDPILSGTTVLSSAVVMRIDHLGDETMLQQIVRAVSESQNTKAPIEELADRITGIFVPVVIYLAIIVSITWLSLALTPGKLPHWYMHGKTQTADKVFFALEFSIAVLAVACPCGIGLAAPAAQAVGAGMAARAGILAQGGSAAFQLATQVDTVVFDKTGTLTQGTPTVVKSLIVSEKTWLLESVRVIEQTSSHPLAAALVRHSEGLQSSNEKRSQDSVELIQVEEVAGKGTHGRIKVQEQFFSFRLGNASLMGDARYTDKPAQTQLVAQWRQQGFSVVFFSLSEPMSGPNDEAKEFVIAAFFAIADPARPEAQKVIKSLKKAGKQIYMLSGDNETTAQTVGRELGIDKDHIVAGVLPHEKAKFIQDLREQTVTNSTSWPWSPKERKRIVMFAGDGLNDSAAVAGADVGVAFAHGSQVTITSASFVLLQTKAPLESVLEVILLSRKVYRRQKMNFGWAMIYNVILIPLSAGAFYPLNGTRIPPVWSALAMALSSVSVVLSSLALRWGL
ncbi:heavy metal translocatin [Serendipita vermifera]|nr:heavy metal translocatin [Serendipita vermifera]